MTIRKITGRALSFLGELVRFMAFMAAAFVILGSIVPASTGARPVTGHPAGLFVLTLALIGVAYLAAELRELGNRLSSTTRR
ncbi:hypothetical protein [Streptomyces sp. NPDC014623]|uniref:hypothetical protein n=1 Tax=Streptomyces sp. NPDC014623 TaxID=3364875 RepID=UPI0036FAA2CF